MGKDHDHDARQAGLDQRIGKARRTWEILVGGDAPAQHAERRDLEQDERAEARDGDPGGNALREQLAREVWRESKGAQDRRQHDRQQDGQGPHAHLLAAQDLASERLGVGACYRFGHHRGTLAIAGRAVEAPLLPLPAFGNSC